MSHLASSADSGPASRQRGVSDDDVEVSLQQGGITRRLSRIRSLTSYGNGKGELGGGQKIILRGVHCKNLLYLSRLGSAPKPYLQFEFNSQVIHKTSVVDKNNGADITTIHPSWASAPPVEFVVPVELLSTKYLHCVLYYSGALYGEERVGVANISLSNLDFEGISDVGFAINCSATEKGKKATMLAEKEGRPLPMCYVTIAYKDDVEN